jgi:hypothetical protein
VWSRNDEDFIRNYAGKVTDEEGARQLSEICGRKVTKTDWREKRRQMGLSKACGRGYCKLRSEETVIPIVIPKKEENNE